MASAAGGRQDLASPGPGQRPLGVIITPSAARLTGSLRDIGYDFPAAVADIVDNSITAGASRVDVTVEFAGEESHVSVSDNGDGMTAGALAEALRYGSRRAYGPQDLGRYGLGLKTASMSQSRSLTVLTRPRGGQGTMAAGTIDLDFIAEHDAWAAMPEVPPGAPVEAARARLAAGSGTTVIWRKLDRVLPERRPDGGHARRRLESMAQKAAGHLGIVFHRYLEGSGGRRLAITVNGEPVRPWNPFAPGEAALAELPPQRFEASTGDARGAVTLRRFVLPPRDEFSSAAEFDRLSGPLKWNRQQGLYIYRAGRLVQWGGWNGIRGIDEHTKLARASLDFGPELDELFHVNVAKMRVAIPAQIRQMLERSVNDLCGHADARYRKAGRGGHPGLPAPAGPPARDQGHRAGRRPPAPGPALDGRDAGLALRAAAMLAGEYAAFERIVAVLGERSPAAARALGLDG
jgi:hypothetical protein